MSSMAYRYEARDCLLSKLYRTAEGYLQHRLGEIVKRNNQTYGDSNPYGEFYYEGVLYRHVPVGQYQYVRTYSLIPDLVPELEKYVEAKQELTEEEQHINRMLSLLFTEVHNRVDFKNLLGENLYIPVKPHLDRLIGEKLSENEFKNVYEKFSQSIDTMRNRMVDNLIAQDLYGL